MQEISKAASERNPIAVWGERLALSTAEIAAIERTGAIACELRGRSTRVYRLLYFVNGKRRTRYLGTKESEVQPLRERLDELKAKKLERRRQRRLIASTTQSIRQRVEQVRAELEPTLAAHGAYFHGRRIRRRRALKPS